jgi:antirestriction protein ArdC
MKGYTVFNVEQCEGLAAQYTGKAEAPALPLPLPQRIEAADRFFAATGADVRHGGTRAYYAEGPDYVAVTMNIGPLVLTNICPPSGI